MIERIDYKTRPSIRNTVFAEYANRYVRIADDYQKQIRSYGISVCEQEYLTTSSQLVDDLVQQGATVANDRKCLTRGWVSPSCVLCRSGLNTVTFSISTQCSRNCFFCFNPNQKDYEKYRSQKDNPSARLDELSRQGLDLVDIALTGGEPLLHKPETEEFIRHAKMRYPDAYLRLYTSGDFLDTAYLEKLRDAKLDEIRISIKLEDSPHRLEHTLDLLTTSLSYIPHVLVEMPVMPNELSQMKALLLALEEIGISGINLLELCFPGHNTNEFLERGYELKVEPFRVLYDYIYAGGLPIAGSEEVCLRLVEFAAESDLQMGVHYCSLENKLSGQINLQNHPYKNLYPYCAFSKKDFFLKSAKVFGDDMTFVERILTQAEMTRFRIDSEDNFIEFHPEYLPQLAESCPSLEIGISYCVVEKRGDDLSLRELRLDYSTISRFDFESDI